MHIYTKQENETQKAIENFFTMISYTNLKYIFSFNKNNVS